jgi:hypothetical protein
VNALRTVTVTVTAAGIIVACRLTLAIPSLVFWAGIGAAALAGLTAGARRVIRQQQTSGACHVCRHPCQLAARRGPVLVQVQPAPRRTGRTR